MADQEARAKLQKQRWVNDPLMRAGPRIGERRLLALLSPGRRGREASKP